MFVLWLAAFALELGMISLLIPVEDTDEVVSCMLDAQRRAKARVHFVLRYDNTDIDNLSRIHELPEYALTIASGDTKKPHEIVNEMCESACGEYLMYWRQEWRFLTSNWDQILQGISIGCTSAHCLIHRDIYRLLGHYALHKNVNEYIFNVGQLSGIIGQFPVISVGEVNSGDFSSEETRICLERDIALIRKELEKAPPISNGNELRK